MLAAFVFVSFATGRNYLQSSVVITRRRLTSANSKRSPNMPVRQFSHSYIMELFFFYFAIFLLDIYVMKKLNISFF